MQLTDGSNATTTLPQQSQGELAVRITVATRGEVATVAANVAFVFVDACIVAAPIRHAPPVVLAAQVLAIIPPFNAGHLCMHAASTRICKNDVN